MKEKETLAALLIAALLAATAAAATTARRPGPNPGPALEAAAKPETLDQIFARKIARTTASPYYQWLHTPHNQRFLPGPWPQAAGEILIDGGWSVRTEGRLDDPGPFAVEEIRTFFRDAGGFALSEQPTDKAIILRVDGPARNRTEGDRYALRAAPGRVEITSPTWRGVLYGVYYLEQLMLERGRPALEAASVSRRPDFDVRMFGDMYATFTVSGLRLNPRPVNRDTFSAISRFGANATFTFVNLTDYLDGSVYPELRNPDREKNLGELRRLAKLCRSVGLDLYLDAYNPKLPSDHPVFKAHPNARGASQFGHDIRSLCPSDPETLKFIADGWADVFKRVPELGGMVTIIGGEGFYHCYMRAGKDGPDCPRCREREPEEVVAGLTNAVFRAVRQVKPDAELLAWPYSAFVWSRDPHQLALIERLDPGIQLVSEIDKDHLYEKDGYVKNIWDYSIDFLGPSDRFKAQKAAVEKRGLKLCAKTETSVSLEFHSVPYIPCLERWGERLEIIKAQKPASIFYAYDIAGFSRSRSEELAGRLSWAPAGTAAEEIGKIARRDFGPATAADMITAWELFSEAVGHCSFLTHNYYRGPSFIGAAQPLMLEDKNIPETLFGRFFYLAEEDMSSGTGQALKYRPIYTEDIKVSPAEIADMDRAVALWERGVAAIEAARTEVEAPYAVEFGKEADLAAYMLTIVRAVAAGNHFFTARREYLEITKKPVISDSERSRAAALLREMQAIAERDLENARRSLVIARRDPRLDLSVRLDLDYAPLTEMIEARIQFQETEGRRQLEAALGGLAAAGAEAVVRRGPLGEVRRQVYAESPGPGVAAIVSSSYLSPGLRRREVHAHEAKSDLGEKFRVRTSEDNGRTWSAFEPASLGTDALRQGDNFMEELAFAVTYDPVSKRTIEAVFQRIFLGDPEQALAAYWRGETKFYDHGFYRLSADGGRTFGEYRQLVYEDGPRFDPDNWAAPKFLETNQMYGSYDITVLSDGTIAYPAIVPVAYQEDEEDRRVAAKAPWYAGKGRVYGALCFIGKWNAAKQDYDWNASPPVWVKRRVSTRGFAEPVVAELEDGRLIMELRGSNVYLDPLKYPGRKWLSVSKDRGRSWSAPADLRYDTGEPFYAPATLAKFVRSRKTGKLYWVGNISRGPAEGNLPRYPLYIAEVDEQKAALKKDTLTIIDDRGPGDTEAVQFSNFSLLDNRETGDLELYLSRLGEKPDSPFSANAYKYTIVLKNK